MKVIAADTRLEEGDIELIPLESVHFDTLNQLADDPRIWEFTSVDMDSEQKRYAHFSKALLEREKGTEFPFVVRNKKDGRLLGSTRLMEINRPHRTLEIGWTWLIPEVWTSEVNLLCKMALLRYCFEELHALRVQLKADSRNMRSRKAIAKIGGQFEGILRNHLIRDNGTSRDSAFFSFIDSEWPEAKTNLNQLILNKRTHD